ncbi:MAG TPA: gamma-glutamyltransferase [Burkholderiaceae bacterium]|nr:gamma-glutamyltransferase [Burkholderiaceae bacterium]
MDKTTAFASNPAGRMRLTHLAVAALVACTPFAAAHADSSDETPGLVSTVSLPAQAKGQPPAWSGKAFRQGVVAVANPYGAEAGAKILEQGGNAVDAAVAIAYALNVVEPQSAGIGGGGFMMIHVAGTGQTVVIDSRERAPKGATPNMFVGVPAASQQGVAVGVPGMVRGTERALRDYGTMGFGQVLQPAIRLADEGFAATPRFVASPNCAGTNLTSRAKNSPLSAEYFCPGGQAMAAGTLVTNKPLAETFRLIAQHGADCFYKVDLAKGCDIALGIVEGQTWNRPQASGGKGGSMTLADLENYAAALRTPIEGSYRGWRIKSMPSPSSGALTVLQVLKMLERFPIGDAAAGYGFGAPRTAQVMADAMRLAFADRAVWMGDADFVPVPAKGLLDSTYVGLRGAAIVPGVRLQPPVVPAADPRLYDVAAADAAQPLRLAVSQPTTGPENGTTHFSVVDKWGNVVSYTNTIESGYGIGVFAGYRRADGSFRNHGFLLNNELTDFNTNPANSVNPFTGGPGFNDVQPDKRPRSSMAPTILFTPDGQPLVAYGSPGGATIINSVINVTLNLVDHKMSLQQAIDAPRLSVTGAGSTIQLDPSFPATTVAALSGPGGLGYTTQLVDIGSVQAVLIDPHTGKQYGAADKRREGTVIGLPRAGGN